jgi:iron complex outermembrane receptor protein
MRGGVPFCTFVPRRLRTLGIPALLCCFLFAYSCCSGEAAPPKESPAKDSPPKDATPKDTPPKKETTSGAGMDLMKLSLEQLMNIQVTSVSKKVEKASGAPAALYVITQDDIRRSGATSIPEALRMAPGLQVARQDSGRWAISSRDYNDEFNAKLLVLMDGRSVYTPLFSGVFWDVQDTMMEDIDRIEVVRGPAGTLWGANAVNGVINVITKSAKDSQGILATAGGGTEETGFGSVRYGGKISKDAYFKVYAKYFNRDNSETPSGGGANDHWDMFRTGYRVDWDVSNCDAVTLQGDYYYGGKDERLLNLAVENPPFVQTQNDHSDVSGANFIGRWSHTFSDRSDLKLQGYYDRTQRELSILDEKRDTYDLDFQYRVGVGDRHEIICGAGARLNHDQLENTFQVSFHPESRTTHVFSTFVQDRIWLLKEKLSLTVGSKFEQNSYTGFEVQPNARLMWQPDARQTVWAAVSRAVRTPSRTGNDVLTNSTVDPTVPVFSQLVGNRNVDSEELLAYELGYRVQPVSRVSLDAALFLNTYDSLISFEGGSPVTAQPPILVPFKFDNKMTGEIYGGELAAKFQLLKRWRLQTNYSFQRIQLHMDNDSTDTFTEKNEGNSPRHQFSARSSVDLSHDVELDVSVRYVDRLRSLNVPSYVTADVRVGWRPTKNLEISLVGQNLLDDRHPEFKPTFVPFQPAEIQRSGYLKMTLKF